MSLVPCPGCSLPRTANDAEFECPICGFMPDEENDDDAPESLLVLAIDDPVPLAPAPPSVAPPPARARRSPLLPWVLAGLGFLGTGVCAVGWYLAVPDSPPASVGVLTSTPFREVAPRPHRVPDPLEVAPAPRTYVEPFEVIRVDTTKDSYKLPAVDGKRRVKLVGGIGKLFLASVSEGAEVDASEVRTRWVNVTGRIDDGATVRLAAPGGLVNFIEGVGTGASVTVDATAGTVTFAKRGGGKRAGEAQPNISGGARVTIRGRQVTFLSPITGDGTTVDVTLGPRGHLKFAELDGGARLLYRQAAATDVPLIVNPGRVKGDAEFKQVK